MISQQQESKNLLLSGHAAPVLAAQFSPDSTLLASGSMDKSILLWDSRRYYQNTEQLKGHTNAVTSLIWTFADRLVSCSADKTAISWDIETGKVARKYKGHTCIINDISAPQKVVENVATASDDGTIRIWQTRSKTEVLVIESQRRYPVTAVSFNLTGDRVYYGGIDNDIKCHNIGMDKHEETIPGHIDTICSLKVSRDGSYLMSNSFDETIRIWNIKSSPHVLTKTMTGHLQGNEKGLLRGAWSVDGLYIANGSIDKAVYIWDTTTRKIVQKLGGHQGSINQVDLGQGNRLVSASNDRTLIVSQLPEVLL